MTVVAIPGELGSFSHAAALATHPSEIRLLHCVDFPELFGTVLAGRADYGIVPIENSLTGSIQENCDLLRDNPLCIVGETAIRVQQCLIVRPGTVLEQVRRVASHPVALAQCRKFFADHPEMTAVTAYDTAGSVRDLMRHELAADAAIASELAARLYGGVVLRAGIEDHPANYTRFLVVSRPAATDATASSVGSISTGRFAREGAGSVST